MKIKLDENLPARLGPELRQAGHDVDTAGDEGLSGCKDVEIWEASQRESRFLITQDMDFSDVRRFEPGTHSGILLVRLRTPTSDNLVERIVHLFCEEGAADWAQCFVVVTDHKIRVRRPGSR